MNAAAFLLGLIVLILTIASASCVVSEIILRRKGKTGSLTRVDRTAKTLVVLDAMVAIPAFIVALMLSSDDSQDKARMQREIDDARNELGSAQAALQFIQHDRSLTTEQKTQLSNLLQKVRGSVVIESVIGREPQKFADELFDVFNVPWVAKRSNLQILPNEKTVGICLVVHSKQEAPACLDEAYLALRSIGLFPVVLKHESNPPQELRIRVGEKISLEELESRFPGSTDPSKNNSQNATMDDAGQAPK